MIGQESPTLWEREWGAHSWTGGQGPGPLSLRPLEFSLDLMMGILSQNPELWEDASDLYVA